MRQFTKLVYDDLISGTATTWYSPSSQYQLLGNADVVGIQACTRGVSGTSPALVVQVEHSVDAQHWGNAWVAPEINGALVTNEGTYYGYQGVVVALLSYVRLRISLTGTSPQCFLRLYVTGRTYSS